MLSKLKKLLESNREGRSDLRHEAKYYAGLLSQKLEQLDICYRYRRSEKDFLEKGVKRVTFKLAITQDEAIWLLIDTGPRKFPRGVSLSDINKPDVLNDLSVTAQRPVRFRQSGDGAWLVVERETGVFGIKEIGFGEMIEHWPQNSRKELLLPFGLAANRRLVYESLTEFPHILIGGATQAGKTTLTHAWICSLVLHTPPDRLNIVLIDLKGGVEYTRYQKLPHVWQCETDNGAVNGFVKERSKAVPILESLRVEMDQRLAQFEMAGGIQNISAWNYRHRSKPMPRIVVFIDELASLMLEPDLKKDAERLLADLGARGRAPGIHLIIATQRPEVSVVSGRIKGNIDGRCCFRVPDNASSMVILDDTSGAQFPEDTPRGRFIYKFGNTRREIQGPWIGPGVIRAKVDSVVEGDSELQAAAIPEPEEIFLFALDNLGGNFPIQKLFVALRGKGVSNRYIRYLAREYEGELIELRGTTYTLTPPQGDFSPRRLVRADELPDTHGGSDVPINDKPNAIQKEYPIVLLSSPVDGHGQSDMADSERDETQNTMSSVFSAPHVEFDIEEALMFAVSTLRGELSFSKIYEQFKGKVSRKDLMEMLQDYECKSVELDGSLYFCEPSAGRRPRRLLKV